DGAPRGDPGDDGRGLGRYDGPQRPQRVPLLPRGAAGHAEPRGGADRQHRLDGGHQAAAGPVRVLRVEARGRRLQPGPGPRPPASGDRGQRDLPGGGGHPADRVLATRGRSLALAPAGRHRGGRGLPGLGRRPRDARGGGRGTRLVGLRTSGVSEDPPMPPPGRRPRLIGGPSALGPRSKRNTMAAWPEPERCEKPMGGKIEHRAAPLHGPTERTTFMPKANVDGVNLYYEEVGAGIPLVFVHEFAGDHASWAPQVRFFARRYRTIAFNAR